MHERPNAAAGDVDELVQHPALAVQERVDIPKQRLILVNRDEFDLDLEHHGFRYRFDAVHQDIELAALHVQFRVIRRRTIGDVVEPAGRHRPGSDDVEVAACGRGVDRGEVIDHLRVGLVKRRAATIERDVEGRRLAVAIAPADCDDRRPLITRTER
ncbi:MAG: hypothetical protein QGG17_07505 [Rhodospirillales bacterium]|nr:hypothetical protein [Rhodospirillales bacterium]